MVDSLVLLAFVPAALLLNLTPGADMMFCLGQGLRSGRGAAVAASAGVAFGGMMHVLLAGLGLSTVIAAQPLALDIIRWIGAGYLIWLAWQSWQNGAADRPAAKQGRHLSIAQAFRQGMLVNLSNPKVILFVLAFVPQFVSVERGAVLGQFLILGLVIALGGFVVNALVGVLAGAMSLRFGKAGTAGRVLARLSALIFLGLALRLIWQQKGNLG